MTKIKKILITAGPTREHLDPVRFLTNLSTGEMGYALARVASGRGYRVSLVSGPTNLPKPVGVKFYSVTSAAGMKKVCSKLFPSHDCLIMTAAVCDFAPARVGTHKIPSGRGLTVRLERTPDILAALARKKGRRVVIGFCLETKDLVRNAKRKLIAKKLDGIVANFYDPSRQVPFGKRNVRAILIDAALRIRKESLRSKRNLAGTILSWMPTLAEKQ